MALASFQGSAWAQGTNGNAAGFEIDDCGALFSGDGNTATPACTGKGVIPCTPITQGDDWAQGASHHGIFDGDGLPNIDPGTGDPYRADLYVDPNWGNSSPTGGVDPTQFGGVSNKNIDLIGDPLIDPTQNPWDWNGVGGGPQKNDITNTYLYTKIDPATGHRWLYVACETRATNGDSHVDFEVNVAGLKLCDPTYTICGAPGAEPVPGVSSGKIVGLGPDGGRTAGQDFIVSVDFVTGGSTPETTVRNWVETAPGEFEFVLVDDLGVDTTGKIFTGTNNCNITHTSGGDWTHFAGDGAETNVMLALQLVEVAIDLTGLEVNIDECASETTVQIKTRSSASFTAELKDFALVPFPLEPTPVCEISGPEQVCPGEEDVCFTVSETTGMSDVTFEWTVTCGTYEPVSGTGDVICVDFPMECDLTCTISVTVNGPVCSSTCEFMVQVDDDTPPEITCPSDVTVQCIEDVPDPDPFSVTATDDCADPVVTWEGDESDGNTCPEIITRTYRATDDCGNTAECTQLIVVDDTIPPEITCPGDLTVQCIEDVPPCDPGDATASDNCDEDVEITCEGDVSDGETCPETITRTYRATDDCGNTAECTQLIVVDDTIPPEITCPGDVTVQCIDDVPAPDTGLASASDNCDDDLDITWEGDVSDGNTCPEIITRTYRATDDCGNTAECTQLIVVDDTIPPSITCPADVSVECIEDVPDPDTGDVTASDNCDDNVAISWEGDVSDGQTCPETITRTYRATDDCGNFSECTQLIVVNDTTPPVISCPPNYSDECVAPGDLGEATATDNCDDDPEITFSDVETVDSPEEGMTTIVRTWVATDECGNTDSCDQTIIFGDPEPPILVCPADLSFQCIEDVPPPDPLDVEWFDNCGTITLEYIGETSEGTCPMYIYRTYQGCDASDNCSTCVQTIIVNDTTPPEITCPADVTVECIDEVPEPDINDVIASDNCDDDLDITWEGDVSDGQTCPETITRTYRATDDCGNTAECTQLIVVDDTIPPTISCPADATYECDSVPAEFGDAVAFDNCDDDVDIGVDESTIPGDCEAEYVLERVFTATDDCGNTDQCTQTITVVDTTPPAITCPPDVSVECIEDVPAADIGSVTAEDNCSTYVVTWEGDVSDGNTCPETITRTYRVTDACGNFSECQQLIVVNDITPPVITCPDAVTVECIADVPPPDTGEATASDNCDDELDITWEGDAAGIGVCPIIIVRVYRATDDCGNTADCEQLIYVNDTTPPVITCPPDATLECPDEVPAPDTGLVSATDNCDEDLLIEWMGDESDGNTCPETITRTYRATDDCGNTAECTQDFVIDDTTPPVITCPPDATYECDDVPADLGSPTYGDTCDQLLDLFAASSIAPGDCEAEYSIHRSWTVVDDCGNSASCSQDITVIDTTPPAITCPAEVTVECIEDVPEVDPGSVLAEDACSTYVVTWEGDESDGNTCPEIITRTYRATDACGNFSECEQIIVVDDTTPPEITCPPNVTVECPDDVPEADISLVTATDNCDDELLIEWMGDVSDGLTCPETITRTYRATDDCGNTAECEQLIVVDDTTAPVITCPNGATVACTDTVQIQIVASDNCDTSPSIEATFIDTADPDAFTAEELGNGLYLITFSGETTLTITAVAIDSCGNESDECTVVIITECPNYEACSPGYWRQPQHFPEWCEAGYNPVEDYCFAGPATLFVDAFDITDFSSSEIPSYFDPDMTLLLEAVNLSGKSFNQALFLGTAALLNAAHPDVNAGASVAEVKEVMQAAFAGDITFAEAKTFFAGLIAQEYEGGCPLN